MLLTSQARNSLAWWISNLTVTIVLFAISLESFIMTNASPKEHCQPSFPSTSWRSVMLVFTIGPPFLEGHPFWVQSDSSMAVALITKVAGWYQESLSLEESKSTYRKWRT